MALKGDTSNLLLADIFQTLSQSRQKGLLTLRIGQEARRVLFSDDGISLYDAKSFRAPRIAHLLESSGRVSRNLLDAAIQGIERLGSDAFSSVALLDRLVERDILERPFADRLLACEVREELLDLFACPRMEFEFQEDEASGESVPKSCLFRTEELVLEAARRMDEWKMILAAIDDLEDYYVARPEVRATDAEQPIAQQLDGSRTLTEVAESLLVSRFEVARAAAKWMDAGTLRLASVKELIEAARHIDAQAAGPRCSRLLDRARARLATTDPRFEELAELYAAAGAKSQAVLCLLTRAKVLRGEKNDAAAFTCILRAQDVDPNDRDVLAALADLYAAREDDKAEAEIATRLATLFAQAGDFEKACDWGSRLARLFPNSPLLDREFEQWCERAERRSYGADVLSQAVGGRRHPERIVLLYESILRLDATRGDIRRALTGLRTARRRRGLFVLCGAIVAVLVIGGGAMTVLKRMHAARFEGRFETAKALFDKGESKLAETELQAIVDGAGDGPIVEQAMRMLEAVRQRITRDEKERAAEADETHRKRLQEVQELADADVLAEAFARWLALDTETRDADARKSVEVKRTALVALVRERRERLTKALARFEVPPRDDAAALERAAAEFDPIFAEEIEADTRALAAFFDRLPQNARDRDELRKLAAATIEVFDQARPGLDEIAKTMERTAELDKLSGDYERLLDLERAARFDEAATGWAQLLATYGKGSLTSFFEERRSLCEAASASAKSIRAALASDDVDGAAALARSAAEQFAKIDFGGTHGIPVRIASLPEGARVRSGLEDLGTTPLDVFVPKGKSKTLTLSAPGFVAEPLVADTEAPSRRSLDLKREGRFAVELGAALDARPAAKGVDLYVGARDGTLYRIDGKSGTITATRKTGSLAGAAEPLLMLGSDVVVPLGEGVLAAFHADSLEPRWKADLDSPFAGAPMVDGDRILVALTDGRIVEVRGSDGNARTIASLGQTLRAGPAAFKDVVAVGTTGGQVIAVRKADGSEIYATPKSPTPVVGLVGVEARFLAVHDDGSIHALDAVTGAPGLEQKALGSVAARPVAQDGYLLLAIGSKLIVLDASSGEQRLSADCGEWISAPPALSGGRIYVGDRSGRMHTFDVQTGAPLFRHKFAGKIAAAPLLLPEGVLVVTDKGELALLGT